MILMKLKLVSIAVVIFLIAGCDHRQKIAKLTTDADDAIAETNYEQAIKNNSEAIQLDPQFAAAYVARAGAYVVLKNMIWPSQI
jgi:outer membrane murein-binding lipoprotein Lpp